LWRAYLEKGRVKTANPKPFRGQCIEKPSKLRFGVRDPDFVQAWDTSNI
jgi:hypothetical protein